MSDLNNLIVEISNLCFGETEVRNSLLKKVGALFIEKEKLPPAIEISETIRIYTGKVYVVIGESGCGKSLLMTLLAAFPPRSWRARVLKEKEVPSFSFFGSEILRKKDNIVPAKKYARKMKKYLGDNFIFYLPQNLPSSKSSELSVEKVFKELTGCVEDDNFFDKYSNICPYEELKNIAVKDLSGGERKRFEILARLYILSHPKNEQSEDAKTLLLLDEPTAGLDCKKSKEFFTAIKNLKDKEGIAIVISTHDVAILDEVWGNNLDELQIIHIEKDKVLSKVTDCKSAKEYIDSVKENADNRSIYSVFKKKLSTK